MKAYLMRKAKTRLSGSSMAGGYGLRGKKKTVQPKKGKDCKDNN